MTKQLKHYLPTVDPPNKKVLVQGKIDESLFEKISELKRQGKWSWDEILEGAIKSLLDINKGDKT
jgi:hypothetical protein